MVAAAGVATMFLFGRGGAEPVEMQAVQVDVQPVVLEEPVVVNENVLVLDVANVDLIKNLESRVKQLEKDFAVLNAGRYNEAFVFVKPHAVTEKVKEIVKEGLEKAGITIKQEGNIAHDKIDQLKLIDNHYGAIANKAVLQKPSELNVPEKGQGQFEKMFGESWSDAIAKGEVYNAKDAAEKLGISGKELDEKWSHLQRGKDLIKFGGGFYCGKVDGIYVMNGFYMAMRDKYCAAPAQIQYYVVQWDPNQLSWKDFREKILGATDPAVAEVDSLRRKIHDEWEKLGLNAKPDVGDNGLHASASPFEAAAERINWTGAELEKDVYGKAALSLGICKNKLKAWMKDAQVEYEGSKQSIFDLLEDLDTSETLEKLEAIRKSSCKGCKDTSSK
uniref:Nucleoside-diphosphate kinase n=1 Tax=Mucochytrium quahogii TaxID=96639 RepID=A0A7S2SHS7_9STRA